MGDVQPFKVEIPQAALDDVRARLKATRWMEDVVGGQARYGASVSFVRSLCDHWLNRFDWRALEAKINAERNVLVDVDGLKIHAIHRRSSRSDATPLILLHGWPSSFLEFLDIIPLLAEPPADQPAFHVVVASLPGNAFSTIGPDVTLNRTGRLMVGLMESLGYDRFIAQGGNWGAPIGMEMARDYPDRVIGLHLNSVNGPPLPKGAEVALTPEEEQWAATYLALAYAPHLVPLSQQPFTPSHAFNDSPAGLAAWVGEKLRDWADHREGPGVSLDWIVGTIALFWFTGTIGASSLLYYENAHHRTEMRYIRVPTAAMICSEEFVRIPRAWAEPHYNFVQWNCYDRGGHFAATEVPDLFAADLREFAKRIRA